MPTICDLKVELKKKGIKGISGLNKAGLQKLLNTGKPSDKKQKSPEKKEEPPTKIKIKKKKQEPSKKKEQPKLLKFKEKEKEKEDKFKNKSAIYLGRLKKKLEAVINDKGSTSNEKNQAINKLKELDIALTKAKQDLKEKRKKKK
jgi:hypothetical protein